MSEVPEELKYTQTHEWIRDNGDGSVTVGITDHAQGQLGDIVFVEVPELGRQLENAEECAVIESVKAASDIYSPVAGEVVEINENLADTPEIINQQPYEDGWLFRVQLDGQLDDSLLDADAYQALVSEEDD